MVQQRIQCRLKTHQNDRSFPFCIFSHHRGPIFVSIVVPIANLLTGTKNSDLFLAHPHQNVI